MFIIANIIALSLMAILGFVSLYATFIYTKSWETRQKWIVRSVFTLITLIYFQLSHIIQFSYEVSYQPLDNENGGWEVVQARDYTSIHALGVTKFYNRDTDDIFDKAYADAMYQKYRRCFVIEYKNIFGKIVNRTVVLSKKEL